VALLESHQVVSLIVGSAFDRAAVEDADPLEGKGAQGSLVSHAASAPALVECICPEGPWDSLAHPFNECLAEKGGT
jgi:hypothetical protein